MRRSLSGSKNTALSMLKAKGTVLSDLAEKTHNSWLAGEKPKANFVAYTADLHALVGFAKHEKWPKQQVRFLQDFLKENGIQG